MPAMRCTGSGPRGGARLGDRTGMRIVGLAAGRTHDLVDEHELARDLVPGQEPMTVGLQVLRPDLPAGPDLDEGDHPLPEPLVVQADHQGIGHVWMAFQCRLDLVGKDLLATGVDAQRAAPVHGDGPVRRHRRLIAREGPPGPVPLDERGRRGVRVAQVADRHPAATSQVADDARPGPDGPEVVVEHGRALVDPQAGWPERVVGRASPPTWPVSDEPNRSATIRPGSSSASWALVDGDRTAPPEPTAISDDRSNRSGSAARTSSSGRAMASPTTTRALARSASTSRQTAAGSKAPPGVVTTVPPPKSVEKANQCPAACMNGGTASAVIPGRSTRSANSSGRVMWLPDANGSPPPMAAKKMSSWRHSTPLGMPVVPPV